MRLVKVNINLFLICILKLKQIISSTLKWGQHEFTTTKTCRALCETDYFVSARALIFGFSVKKMQFVSTFSFPENHVDTRTSLKGRCDPLVVQEALGRYGCADSISLVSGRNEVSDLLKLDQYIDLIIPRYTFIHVSILSFII